MTPQRLTSIDPGAGSPPGLVALAWTNSSLQREPAASMFSTGGRHTWAVGDDALGNSTSAYYNGSSWHLAPVPAGGELRGVTAPSETNAWAAGIGKSGSGVLRWNGSVWTQITGTALDNGYIDSLTHVAHSAELWAVGGVLDTGGPFAAYNP